MGLIPEQIVDEVRNRADIVSVIGRYVTLRKQGVSHKGLCPFHAEKTPSFNVHEEKQIFHCFGCEVGGDVFAFRMRYEGLDFPDAVRSLAKEFGVEIPESGGAASGRVIQIYRVNDAAARHFRASLRSHHGAPARRYLEERGIPSDLEERFQIGFAPAGWEDLVRRLERDGESLEVALQAGLIAERQAGDGHYDRFRERLVFPIAEPNGRVIGFGGRALGDGEPKYLNSPETPVYRKGRALFGLAQAVDAIRAAKRVVVVEGYFDVLALHRAGLAEVVAPCGTALTQDHARRMRRYTDSAVLLFDGDAAGLHAAERSLPVLLTEGFQVRAAFLPAGEDPDTLIAKAGPEALRAAVDAAEVLLEHLLDRQLRGTSESPRARAEAVQSLAPYLRAIPDAIERADYLRRLAARLDLPVAAVERATAGKAEDRPEEPPSPSAPQGHFSAESVDTVSRTLIGVLTAFPGLVERIEPAHLDELPSGAGREILACFVTQVREQDPRVILRLMSPNAEALAPDLRDVLVALAANAEPLGHAEAERAVRDCLSKLERRVREREERALTTRIREARDPLEIEELLEAKQRLLDARRTHQAVVAPPTES